MLNFDPHRWLEEHRATTAAPEPIATLARLAGPQAQLQKSVSTETPANPATPATNRPIDDLLAASRLKEWHRKLSALDQFNPPPGRTLSQWMTLVDSACWLYESYGSQAVRLGWSSLDLWGLLPAVPGAGGLADRIGNARNLKLSDDLACWSFLGVKQQFARGGGEDLVTSGLVPLWRAA